MGRHSGGTHVMIARIGDRILVGSIGRLKIARIPQRRKLLAYHFQALIDGVVVKLRQVPVYFYPRILENRSGTSEDDLAFGIRYLLPIEVDLSGPEVHESPKIPNVFPLQGGVRW